MRRLNLFPLLAMALGVASLSAQSFSPNPASRKSPAVAYLFPEQVTVAADKPASVDLHFRIAEGMHINSHTPRTENLIPTTFKLPDTTVVRLTKAQFPVGADYSFSINPAEKLSVYTGEFIIHAEFVASKGDHLVEGILHYQACNNDSCLPPRSIPVAIDVIAR